MRSPVPDARLTVAAAGRARATEARRVGIAELEAEEARLAAASTWPTPKLVQTRHALDNLRAAERADNEAVAA